MLYEDRGLSFKYSFGSDAASSYLVLELESGSQLISHQAELISRNPSSAFAAFYIRRENETICIYYNITSKISLSQYLERKRLNRKELLDLLDGISRALLLHSSYLLDLPSFILQPDFVFINPATAEASLVYLPVYCSRNSADMCRSFLKDLVVNSANAEDNAKDNYMQRILGYLKSELFNLNEFNRLIADLRYNAGQYESTAPAATAVSAACTLPAAAKPPKSSGKAIGRSKGMLRTLTVHLLIILPVVIIFLFLVSRGIADPVSSAGILVIGAAVDFLLMKRPLAKPAEERAKLAKVKRLKASDKIVHLEAPAIPEIVRASDTVMISEASSLDHPYLERVEAQSSERIVINKDRFTIGRLGSMVDHVIPDGTIGKLHAEIITRDGDYYLIDLNSKNGTYINGERIACNREHQITGCCRIRFSGYEYVFRHQPVQTGQRGTEVLQ